MQASVTYLIGVIVVIVTLIRAAQTGSAVNSKWFVGIKLVVFSELRGI